MQGWRDVLADGSTAVTARPFYAGPLLDGHLHTAGAFGHAATLLAALDRGAHGLVVDRAVLVASPVAGAGARRVPWLFHRTVGTWGMGKRLSWHVVERYAARGATGSPDNEVVARLVAAAPERLAGFAFVDPRADAPERAARYWVAERGFRGLKLHGWVHRARLLSEGVQRVAAGAGRLGVPVLLHPGLEPGRAAALEALTGEHAATRFIIPHLDEDALELAARRENVFLDTSGLCMTPTRLAWALRRAGPEKLIFGSDGPGETGGDLGYSLRLLAGAGLGAADLERICWRNLAGLLGWD
jgi:hypothetical protein